MFRMYMLVQRWFFALTIATLSQVCAAQANLNFSYFPLGYQYPGAANPVYSADLAKPAGATTQWISFWLYSGGYFANTNSHIAIGLRGTAFAPAPFFFRGRGIIVGKSYLSTLSGQTAEGNTKGGCLVGTGPWSSTSQPPGTIQVETWNNTDGGIIYSNSCSAAILQDFQWYQISVAANDGGWVAYDVYDINGHYLAHFDGYFPPSASIGTTNGQPNGPLETEGSQVFILHDGTGAYGQPNDFGRYWSLNIQYINHGWF